MFNFLYHEYFKLVQTMTYMPMKEPQFEFTALKSVLHSNTLNIFFEPPLQFVNLIWKQSHVVFIETLYTHQPFENTSMYLET